MDFFFFFSCIVCFRERTTINSSRRGVLKAQKADPEDASEKRDMILSLSLSLSLFFFDLLCLLEGFGLEGSLKERNTLEESVFFFSLLSSIRENALLRDKHIHCDCDSHTYDD